jgi:hypothetical protein
MAGGTSDPLLHQNSFEIDRSQAFFCDPDHIVVYVSQLTTLFGQRSVVHRVRESGRADASRCHYLSRLHGSG